MKITPINKENLSYYQDFISDEDAHFIREDLKLLPLGLVANDIYEGKNIAAGAICIRPEDFMLDISSLYVAPEYRGRGAGRFLLEEAKRIFGGPGTEFTAEFLLHGKEEEGLAKFFEACGFSDADPEYEVFAITVDELKNTDLAGKQGKGVPFNDISHIVFNYSQAEAAKNGAILPLGGFRSEAIDRDVSVGILNEENHIIESFAVFEILSEQVLLFSSLFSRDKDPATLLHILEASTKLITEKYPGQTKIIIQPVNETAESFIKLFFEDAKDISCRYRYCI